ncbi:unnamed protein product [Protopolystoma xenopodis]|uniref:Uncharacterized protein n=1 Tax=Protopolystoma xenopodis TaxID=117903 RepID=A0A3S5FH92_9PLAT|nr:unnamed protein product [Protopolystoma xenopodis]
MTAAVCTNRGDSCRQGGLANDGDVDNDGRRSMNQQSADLRNWHKWADHLSKYHKLAAPKYCFCQGLASTIMVEAGILVKPQRA